MKWVSVAFFVLLVGVLLMTGCAGGFYATHHDEYYYDPPQRVVYYPRTVRTVIVYGTDYCTYGWAYHAWHRCGMPRYVHHFEGSPYDYNGGTIRTTHIRRHSAPSVSQRGTSSVQYTRRNTNSSAVSNGLKRIVKSVTRKRTSQSHQEKVMRLKKRPQNTQNTIGKMQKISEELRVAAQEVQSASRLLQSQQKSEVRTKRRQQVEQKSAPQPEPSRSSSKSSDDEKPRKRKRGTR